MKRISKTTIDIITNIYYENTRNKSSIYEYEPIGHIG